MNRIFVATAAAVVLFAGVANVASAEPSANTLIAQDTAKPLTIAAAKKQVDAWLSATGHGALRASKGEFDGQGNVKVEVVNPSGTPYTHVLVHANDGAITDARANVSPKG